MCGTNITFPWPNIVWLNHYNLVQQGGKIKIPQHDRCETVEVIGEIKAEEGDQHFRYQRSSSIGEVIVSVFVLLDLHIVYLNKWIKRLIYIITSLFYVQHLKQRQLHHHNNQTH